MFLKLVRIRLNTEAEEYVGTIFEREKLHVTLPMDIDNSSLVVYLARAFPSIVIIDRA
jgi:hypothetical protein